MGSSASLPAGAGEAVSSAFWLSTSDISVLLSAILGALIAGVVSWLLARQTSNETLRRDAALRTDALGASALRLMIKASLILSDAQSLDRILREAIANGEQNFPGAMRWQYIPGIATDYQVFEVEADELRPLLTVKEHALFQSAVTMIMVHRDLVNNLRRYAEERDRLREQMPPELQHMI